jgi:hypothetical protein
MWNNQMTCDRKKPNDLEERPLALASDAVNVEERRFSAAVSSKIDGA